MADVLSDHFHGDFGGRRGKEMLGSSILPGVGDLVADDAFLRPLSITAREAKRPQPTDGLRWHPLSPKKQYPVLEVVEMPAGQNVDRCRCVIHGGELLKGDCVKEVSLSVQLEEQIAPGMVPIFYAGHSFDGDDLGKAQQLLSTTMVVAAAAVQEDEFAGVAHKGCCRVEEVPGGGGMVPTTHVGGSFGQEVCGVRRRISSLASPERLAPPFGERRRDSILDGWEEELRAQLVTCARKKESVLLSARILRKKLNRAMEESGLIRSNVGCRRSSRLSAPPPSSCSDLANVMFVGLSPVAEVVGSEGELSEETLGAKLGLFDGLSAMDGHRQLPVMEENGVDGVSVHLPATGEAAQAECGAVAGADAAMVVGVVDGVDDGEGLAVGGGGLASGTAMGIEASVADGLCLSGTIDSVFTVVPASVSLPDHYVSTRADEGITYVGLAHSRYVCVPIPFATVDLIVGGQVSVSDGGGLVSDGRVAGGGGSVSEEVRAASAAREALRSRLRWAATASLVPGGAREWCFPGGAC
ncbi:hypothetical protein Dimus_009010 [Dionaea muscipula]